MKGETERERKEQRKKFSRKLFYIIKQQSTFQQTAYLENRNYTLCLRVPAFGKKYNIIILFIIYYIHNTYTLYLCLVNFLLIHVRCIVHVYLRVHT